MAETGSGRLVEPRLIWDNDVRTSTVVCVCGSQMTMETGRDVDGHTRAHEWAWWRCRENPLHITRAIPFPVRMARG